MTPYWPSPLGATRRRLAPNRETQASLFPVERALRSHRFPKPQRGVTWVAEADLPMPRDFELGADGQLPETG